MIKLDTVTLYFLERLYNQEKALIKENRILGLGQFEAEELSRIYHAHDYRRTAFNAGWNHCTSAFQCFQLFFIHGSDKTFDFQIGEINFFFHIFFSSFLYHLHEMILIIRNIKGIIKSAQYSFLLPPALSSTRASSGSRKPAIILQKKSYSR